MSTVVIEGLLYSARRVLSKPVTEISSGTRRPDFNRPLMTPTAVESFTPITAVVRGFSVSLAPPALKPPSKRHTPGDTGPGASARYLIHSSHEFGRATPDSKRGLP